MRKPDSRTVFGVFLILLLTTVTIAFITVTFRQIVQTDEDKRILTELSSFTVKNNSDVQSDYDKLAEYIPKTDDGEKFKDIKMKQKLSQIEAYRITNDK